MSAAAETPPQHTREGCAAGDAALRRAFEFLGRRWSGVVLGSLINGAAGFRDISRAAEGISDSVLSERLASLVRGGLISRTVDEGPPVAVAYALTERGEALIPALAELTRWAQEHLPPDEA
jgi:DNA-binding HxlR family transcriptional regulator